VKAALLLIWGCGLLSSQTLDISGTWRLHGGDDPSYAKPELDDSGWETIELPLRTTLPARVSWLRKTVDLPAGVRDATLVLGGLQSCYSVFVNALSAGDSGCGKGGYPAPVSRGFRLPRGTESGRITVAIRVTRIISLFRDEGPYVIAGASDAAWQLERGRLLEMRQTNLYSLFAYTQILMALILLVLWLGTPGRIELLWFTLTILAFALFNFAQIAGPYTGNHPSIGVSILGAVFFLNLGMSHVVNGRALAIWKAAVLAAALVLFRFAFSIPLLDMIPGLALPVFWSVRLVRRGTIEQRVLACGVLLYAASFARVIAGQLVPGLYASFTFFIGPYGLAPHTVINIALCITAVFALIGGLLKDQQEKGRLAKEMEAGRSVQQLLLQAPQSSRDLAIDAMYLPAAEVGGDFWQSFRTADGAHLVVVGDVSGKGLKAAMLVSLIAGALRNRKSDRPAALLAELNQVAVESLKGGFVTATVARIQEGTVTIASAGHPAPYLDGAEAAVDPGLPLGIDRCGIYAESTLSLKGMLTFVSDGVIESANAKGELFGFERTAAVSKRSAREIAEAALAWGQNDDITVVTVRRLTS